MVYVVFVQLSPATGYEILPVSPMGCVGLKTIKGASFTGCLFLLPFDSASVADLAVKAVPATPAEFAYSQNRERSVCR